MRTTETTIPIHRRRRDRGARSSVCTPSRLRCRLRYACHLGKSCGGVWPASRGGGFMGVERRAWVLAGIGQRLGRSWGGSRERSAPPLPEPVNGVTAFHLWWQGIDGGEPLVDVSAALSVLR